MFFRPLRTRIVFVLSFLLLTTLFSAMALAQKKGGGTIPPAPGVIYFIGEVQDGGRIREFTMRMDGDGSGKANVPRGVASYRLHGGSPSFLSEDVWYGPPVDEWGDPTMYVDLFVTVLVNGEWQRIQLTNDPSIYWLGVTDYSINWSRDDSFVSCPAIAINEAGEPVGGLFIVPIDWTTGIPVAGSPRLAFATDFRWVPSSPYVSSVNIEEHDWSPDGTALVYVADDVLGDGQLDYAVHVADFAAASVRRLSHGNFPQWSPAGNRIAFNRRGAVLNEIWTINPDGSNAIRLTQSVKTNKESRSQSWPTWSPDGAFLAFTEHFQSNSKSTFFVRRIPSAGGTSVNLTTDIHGGYSPRWRP